MAVTIFLCGHGEWEPKNGFVDLPKGCSITFVVHFAKTLPTKDMFTLCRGTYPNEPDRIVAEFHSCPNMTWKVDEDAVIDHCIALAANNHGAQPAEVLFPNSLASLLDKDGALTLGKFFRKRAPTIHERVMLYGEVKFIWASCSALAMNRTARGGIIGVNAQQKVNAYIHMDRSVHKAGVPIGWSDL